jgi:C_GCAxxG_C_C family probable redox protein
MIETVSRKSRKLFNSGYRCAESVLMAVAESRDIQSDLIPRIATGFCGGVSNTNGTCGAVSGAIMAINLLKGRSDPTESREENYKAVQKFIEGFQKRFQSIQCGELTGCDLRTEEGKKAFIDGNKLEICLDFTEEATRLALEILEKQQ